MRVVLRIDAEPDGFLFDPAHPPSWASFETALQVMTEARTRLEEQTGSWPTYAWAMRCDPQIEAAYGSLDWALDHYAERLDDLRAAGDDIGLHTHYYRRDGRRWIVEFKDTQWITKTLDDADASFRASRGHAPAFFASGNKMVDQHTITHIGRLGIPYDTSVEPGLFVRARRWYHADDCDFRAVPTQPYVPDPADFRKAAPPGTTGAVLVPAATGRPGLNDAPLLKSLALRARVFQQQRTVSRRAWSTLYFSQRPWQFKAILADVLRRGPPDVLHVPTRNCLRPDWTRANLETLAALDGTRFQGFTGIEPAATEPGILA